VNCNRSPGAIISLELLMHISLLDGDNLEVFVQSLRNYVDDNPRDWNCVLFHRIVKVVCGMEQVVLRLELRHRNGWQTAARIMQDNGNLQKFLHQVGERMGVNNVPTPNTSLIYSAGSLKNGSVQDYTKNLMTPSNIRNFGNEE
jgi:hypothetical protein